MIIQNKENPLFSKYNFGKEGNLKVYGQEEAPLYDLNRINIPVRAHVGRQDTLATPLDNEILKRQLKDELKKDYEMYLYDKCGHLTFMWGRDMTAIFKQIEDDLVYAEQKNKANKQEQQAQASQAVNK